MRKSIVGAACCLVAHSVQADRVFPPECPRRGTLEVVENPSDWADQCFAAFTGRMPEPGDVGETDSVMRDLDLDGVAVRLEIRGTGNSVKQIYVFKATTSGFIYLGVLDAHPSFAVARDGAGTPTISYVYRAGVDHQELKRIQYRDSEYVEISSERIR